MLIRVTTRHSEDFDILCGTVDPSKSPYAHLSGIENYCGKVKSLCSQLCVECVIWTTPESEPPEFFEPVKPVEYFLELQAQRAVAYIDELTWTAYLRGEGSTFQISKDPRRYHMTSILVSAPIRSDEVKEVRRYCEGNAGRCKLIGRKPWRGCVSASGGAAPYSLK
jgi:hypothetical protein